MKSIEDIWEDMLLEVMMKFGDVRLDSEEHAEFANTTFKRLLKEAIPRKSGTTWKAQSGKFAGKHDNVTRYFSSPEAAKRFATGKSARSEISKDKEKTQPSEKQVDIKDRDAAINVTKIKSKANELKKIPYTSKSDAAIGIAFLNGLASGDLSVLRKYKDTINKYFRINPGAPKLYFALKEPNNFKGGLRDKMILPQSVVNALQKNGMKEAAGITTSTGEKTNVGGDILSVSNFTQNKEPKHLEIKESDVSVAFGDHSIPILNEPSFDELVSGFVKKGIPQEQARAEAGVASRAIKKHNELVKYTTNLLKDPKLNKFVDPLPGTTPSTPEGREKIKNKVLEDLSSTISSKVQSDVASTFAKRIKDLQNSQDFEKDILQISFDMEKEPSLQRANQRFVETISYLRKLHAGYIAYMPAVSNFPLEDELSIKELNLKENPTTDEIISALNLITVSIEFGSVKKDSGAAASVGSKINATIYKTPKTRKNLETIKNSYNIVWNDRNPDEASKVLQAMAKEYNIDIKKYTTPEKLEQVETAWKRFKNQPQHIKDQEMYRKQLTQYMIAGQMIEEIYNSDIQYQMFSNEKYKMLSDHLGIEVTDGVKSVSKIKFRFNVFGNLGRPIAQFPTQFYKAKD
jgi:hypothetical protein